MNTNIFCKLPSAHTKTVRLPEALGIPAAMLSVQGGTARFAVRVRRYKTWLHLLRPLPLAPTLTSRRSLAHILTPAPHVHLKLLLFEAALLKVCIPYGHCKDIAPFNLLPRTFLLFVLFRVRLYILLSVKITNQ